MKNNASRGEVQSCQPSHTKTPLPVACSPRHPCPKYALPFLVSLTTTLKHPSDLTVLAPCETRDMFVSMSIDLSE